MMKAPWKILLNVCTDNRTFYIGNRYIYAYDVKQHQRMRYKLDDNWKVALTALGQSEAMVKDPAQVMSTVLKFFNCVDKTGSFDPRDYFTDDDLEDARNIIDDYTKVHVKALEAATKYRENHKHY